MIKQYKNVGVVSDNIFKFVLFIEWNTVRYSLLPYSVNTCFNFLSLVSI